jgi:hypothetical protein
MQKKSNYWIVNFNFFLLMLEAMVRDTKENQE